MTKAKYGKSGGVDLTDELIESLAAEATEGYGVERLRTRARRGRPPIGSEAAALFQVRLEPELRKALSRSADERKTSPSELARRALRAYLSEPAPATAARQSLWTSLGSRGKIDQSPSGIRRPSTASVDWPNILDIQLAARNCSSDILGDWHRDPWTWPEIAWASTQGTALLVQRLNSKGSGRAALLDVAKENFVLRPALVLDPIDRLMYEALVDRLSVDLIGELAPWVYGWRLERGNPKPGRYASRSREWALYRSHLVALAETFSFGLLTDVVSCFASVPLEAVFEQIERLAGSNAVSVRLIDMLESWGRISGRSGLPQRANGSSVLANMYLRPIDDALYSYGRQPKGSLAGWLGHDVAATRWMDDIWLFANDPAHLRQAQMHLQDVMQSLGLQISAAKTRVLEGDDLVAAAREVEHSAVDQHLAFDPPDPQPLEALVEQLIGSPETAPSTSVRFATHRIRDQELFAMAAQFVEVAGRMPHAATYLARLFRDAGTWRALPGWYVRHSKSSWGSVPWAVAQLGTMFPTHSKPISPVDDGFQDAISESKALPLFSVAAQRLASWKPSVARSLFREAAKLSSEPHQRRVMALAAVEAGEETAWIRKLLSEFDENAATLEMLRHRRFRPVRVAPDFEGDAD